jgi:hypothetical protein
VDNDAAADGTNARNLSQFDGVVEGLAVQAQLGGELIDGDELARSRVLPDKGKGSWPAIGIVPS